MKKYAHHFCLTRLSIENNVLFGLSLVLIIRWSQVQVMVGPPNNQPLLWIERILSFEPAIDMLVMLVELQRKVSHYLQPILSHRFLNNLA